MFFIPKLILRPIKQMVAIVGLLLVILSLPLDFGLWLIHLVRIMANQSEAISTGISALIVTGLTLGTGGTLFWHAVSSLQNKPSKKFTLPSVGKLAGVFGLYLLLGAIIFNSPIMANLFFPITIAIAAALPSCIAVAWFMNHEADRLTWRQSLVVFSGSATVGAVAGGILQLLLLTGGAILIPHYNELDLDRLLQITAEGHSRLWQDRDIGIYLFIQITVIYPLITELVKPLIVLPFSNYLSRREIFLLGAIAGAGFALLENVTLAGFGSQSWAWLLILQFLGGAIHPLSSGLVALGWRDILRGESHSWSGWLAHFGVAVALRALWNTGFLTSLILIGSGFTGIGVGGGGLLLGLIGASYLTGLGATALWLGYEVAQGGTVKFLQAYSVQSNHRAVAIWAIASLLVVLPVGILTNHLLFR